MEHSHVLQARKVTDDLDPGSHLRRIEERSRLANRFLELGSPAHTIITEDR
jgi:hypothetical protein